MAHTQYTKVSGIEIVNQEKVGWRHVDTNDKPISFNRFVGPIYKTKMELLADHRDYLIRAGWMK